MLIKYLRLLFALIDAILILWIKFPRLSRDEKLMQIRNWSMNLLHVMKIHVDMSQANLLSNSVQTQLVVANHVSWLDVLIIQSFLPSVFIAKKEVRHWPIVGSIAQACGVIFVDRSSPSSAKKMVNDVTTAMRHGYCVAGFPEGTSSEGLRVHLFHANVFEAAIHHDTHVLPIALRYTDTYTGNICLKAAFVGDTGFLRSLHQVMQVQRIDVRVKIGRALSPKGHSRRTLSYLSHQCVLHQLNDLHNAYATELV